MGALTRRLIRADGTIIELRLPVSIAKVEALIGAEGLDTVQMRHMGLPLHVMMVDDLGHPKGLPINEEATRLYHANCRPGSLHPIRGDVVIVPDLDFAPPDDEGSDLP